MLNSACATDVNHIRNMELSDIIGQPQVISVLELNLQAFQNLRMSSPGSKPQFGPGLCSGPSGTGKTVTVKAAHNAIGNSKFIAVNGVTLGKKGEFFSVMMNADDDTTVFVDEAQAIDKKTQQLLLTAISERKLHVPVGDFNAERFTISLANFTLFLATTDEHCLIGPLRNRMRFNCRFDYYQIADLIEILRRASGCPSMAVRVRRSFGTDRGKSQRDASTGYREQSSSCAKPGRTKSKRYNHCSGCT